jgi:hypothetical protein
MKPLLYWLPRVLGLLVVAYLSIFAADVFSEGAGAWRTLIALAGHLIPSAILLVFVAIAWRWEAAGGLLFIAIAAVYTMWVLIGHRPSLWILVIAGPAFVVGALFMMDWCYRRHACAC